MMNHKKCSYKLKPKARSTFNIKSLGFLNEIPYHKVPAVENWPWADEWNLHSDISGTRISSICVTHPDIN